MKILDKKIQYWEHQLLDLGKRNRMINYRETKRTTIKLIEPSFDELYNKLATNEETLTFQRSVDRETDIRVFSILSLLENLSAPLPVTIGDIKTEGSIIERQKTLKNLRAKSRLAQEEQGTNILYLSFGFIEWKDGKGASAQWIKSPLVLVPAVLSLEALNSPYTLKKHEDDIVVNPTLEYYLKTEYGIELPSFDADKDTLDNYFKELEEIADQRGWRILKEVNLGLLSFLKISMYNDLLKNEERIKKNPVVRAMAGDATEANEIPENLRNFNLDLIDTQDCYQVMSADSSQQDAILYSKNNVSFVMQGPPGTGKSQTITNIIAEALADGKKVLFVSEKMAALQVVYRRLLDAHLGDFCLPLHSYKANKKEILEQIGANLKLKQTRVKDVAISNLQELLSIRQELNKYAYELHALNPKLNISCYEVYSKLEELCDTPKASFTLKDPLDISQAKLQTCLKTLREYSLSLKRLNNFIKNNPWEGLSSRESGFEFADQMQTALKDFTDSIHKLIDNFGEITESHDICDKISYNSICEISQLITNICELPQVPEIWLKEYDFDRSIKSAQKAKITYKKLFELRYEISKVFLNTVYQFDYNNLKKRIAEQTEYIINLPLLKGKTADFFVKEAESLHAHFQVLKDALESANSAYKAINDKLGTSFLTNAFDQETVTSLCELISKNVLINEGLFSSDHSKVTSLLTDAQNVASEIIASKNNLLSEWEPDVFNLDYSSILMRFKTEYTSIFKVFKAQYKQDKKQIQGLSRAVLKKMPDDTAIELLTKLKFYNEKTEWLNQHTTELRDLFGEYYSGLDTDWEVVFDAMNICSQIKALSSGEISSKLIDVLSKNHAEDATKLNEIISKIKDSIITAKNEIIALQADVKIDSVDFDVAETIRIVATYLDNLSELSESSQNFKPYLVCAEEKFSAICDAIDKVNSYNETLHSIDLISQSNKHDFEYLFAGENTNWDNVLLLLNSVAQFKNSDYYPLMCPLINISSERKAELIDVAQQIRDSYNSASSVFEWINQQFLTNTTLQELSVTDLSQKIIACLNNISILESWIDYQEAKSACLTIGLDNFIEKYEDSYLGQDIEKLFLKGFYHMWLDAVCSKSSAVRRFRKNTQDERISKFIQLDDLQLKIAQMRIREKLIENLPSSHILLKATDELAILNKELGKKNRIMPLRKLFRMIPNLLMKLKPCLMMSPLSVSYFLETEAYHFDVVIFDEASQIFPEDAIGAIFRGSQVIIAGDSKQLPPTNFFSSTTNNFDGDYDISDEDDLTEVISDSILEESASVLPNRTLLWHYRSKNENLIAFSNREIYKNDLITFPNSINNVPDMGVEYIYVEDGIYDRGGKKNNIREAEECVKLVFQHIEKHPDRSLGIIAFSESQQTTIENAIVDYRERNPKYEWFFDESKDEPFFVKNLENVQGDERDTIIFSICYGKDKNGIMYMNFGPVGHDGGERRLNVAITRAKCNIKLVGSILPSDIDIERAKSEGARMLRSYIEYARKGSSALKPIEKVGECEIEDNFCKIIGDFLESHGYSIERQVGCSDYKIDIGVKNPKAEDEFIAGIECDGLSYKQAKTARDRDHLRKTVLQNMGWNLYRVWSTEWIRNPKSEGQALLDFLNSLYDKKGNVTHSMKQSNAKGKDTSLEIIATETRKVTDGSHTDNPYGFDFYREANWWDAEHKGSRDNFTRIGENIYYIVRMEEPIHLDVLYKRMGPSFTTGKATDSVKRTIDQVIAQKLNGKVSVDKNCFVRLLPLTDIKVRIPQKHEPPRPIEYIHTEEVAMAMAKIIEKSFGITEEDLASECARVFGFERKGPKIKTKTDAAIKWLIDNKKIRIIDGKIQLIGE